MRIPDGEVKRLIRAWRNGDKSAFEKIKNLTAEYVLNFPLVVYGQDEDTCHDFYLYVLERLEGIISRYKEIDGVKFQTWFTRVLSNQYKNFVSYARTREYEFEKVGLESGEGAVLWLIEEKLEPPVEKFGEIHRVFSKLSIRERVVLKLTYGFELSSDELLAVSKFTGKNYSDVVENYIKLIESKANLYPDYKKLFNKVSEAFAEMLKCERKGRNDEAEGWRKVWKRRLEELKKHRLTVNQKDVAEFVGSSWEYVRKVLHSARRKIKIWLEENSERKT